MSDRRLRKSKRSAGFERLPLNGLRVFESVASHLSFTEAAESLHETPAAVSMQIRVLEQYLRVPLFRRKGRSITLTAEGELLLPGVRRGLSTLQQSMQQLRQDRLGGGGRIRQPGSFLPQKLFA